MLFIPQPFQHFPVFPVEPVQQLVRKFTAPVALLPDPTPADAGDPVARWYFIFPYFPLQKCAELVKDRRQIVGDVLIFQ